MRKVSFAVMVVCMMLTGIAQADEFIYDGPAWTSDSTAWEVGDNWINTTTGWSRGVLPGEFDLARIAYGAEAQLNSTQTVNFFGVGSNWAGAGTATINSGGLRCKDQVNGKWWDGQLYVGDNVAGTGVLNIYGGASVVDRVLVFGNNAASATGTLNMYGGTLDVGVNNPRGAWDGGLTASAGNAYINMYGGTVTTSVLKDWNAGSGDYEIYFGSTDGKIIVTEEWLIDPGQFIANMLAAGQITAAPGLEIVMQKFETAPGSGVWDAEIFAQVPEPATMALLGLGSLLLRRRKK